MFVQVNLIGQAVQGARHMKFECIRWVMRFKGQGNMTKLAKIELPRQHFSRTALGPVCESLSELAVCCLLATLFQSRLGIIFCVHLFGNPGSKVAGGAGV